VQALVFGRFLGVSILIPGVLVLGIRVLGVASSGPGGFRLTRLLQIVAGELWLGGYFKGYFVGGSVRKGPCGRLRIYF